jgi:hypothetical protein
MLGRRTVAALGAAIVLVGVAGAVALSSPRQGVAAPRSPDPAAFEATPQRPGPTASASMPASPAASDGPAGRLEPDQCTSMGLAPERCLAVVEAAMDETSIAWSNIDSVALAPAPSLDPSLAGGSRTIAAVTFALPDGSTRQVVVGCPGITGEFSLVCTDHPRILLSIPVVGYHDLPCRGGPGGSPGSLCATPVPSIDPAAAPDAVTLRIPAKDIPISSTGHLEIDLGRATLPNGVLSDARFSLADPYSSAFRVEPEGIRLEVRSLDPSRPPFENAYAHGWYPGTEDVEAYLVLDVTSFTPGARIEVRDLIVR